MFQRQSNLVQSVQQAILAETVHVKSEYLAAIGIRDRLRAKIDDQLEARKGSDIIEYPVHLRFGQHDRQQSILETIVIENVGVARCNNRAKSVIFQRPRRMLTRRTATEVLSREQNAGALVARLVQNEVRIALARAVIHAGFAAIQVTPGIEQVDAEPRTLDRLQELLRDNRIGIDIGSIQWGNQALQSGEFLHYGPPRTSTKCPAIAAPAAMAGLTRWVRPPDPCLPSKLRLDVEAQRSPGSSRSSFMARHMEHPGWRHSKPAA